MHRCITVLKRIGIINVLEIGLGSVFPRWKWKKSGENSMRLKNGKKDNLALCFMQVHCETWPKWKVKDDTMTFVAQKICNLPHYKMGQGWRCNIFRGQNWVLEFLRRRTDFIWVTWNIHCPVYIRAQKWGPICNISTLGSVFFSPVRVLKQKSDFRPLKLFAI